MSTVRLAALSLPILAAGLAAAGCGTHGTAGVPTTYSGRSAGATLMLVLATQTGTSELSLRFSPDGLLVQQRAERLQRLDAFCAWSVRGISDRGLAIAVVRPSDLRKGSLRVTWSALPRAHDYICGLRDGRKPEGESSATWISEALLAVAMTRQ
jgi:hypothetical protein